MEEPVNVASVFRVPEVVALVEVDPERLADPERVAPVRVVSVLRFVLTAEAA